ncbi:nuclear pore complex protein Nup153-like, partial [Stegodyphus dumicola]|uniref:nuclear pore complex protein Nup153-like n=1 Tax=Stegodyphus dumicola TaxID=202533 RepID=UPI0015A8E5F8
GDDHSENSDGSASTSGCSSLVSSHKDRPNFLPSPCLRLRENAFENLQGEINDNRKNVTPQKNSLPSNVNSSRSPLWSSTSRPSVKYPRSPSIIQSNQPSFNLSKFIGPSKLNPLVERKVASPFYEGKTSFGGASSNCRTSLSIAPYQVERPLKNHIRVQVKQSEDSLEGMSSAARRILQTLEKMSSPVMDAKKIPNTNKSPVDLSLYLSPRKVRRNTVLTPTSTTKGPPIADISTISRLATLKNHGLKRCRISPVDKISTESSILNVEEKEHRQIITDQGGLANSSFDDVSKGGGGKMRTKLNQQHRPCKEVSENEVNYDAPLPNIPLPISKLPTFTFHPDSQVDKTSSVAKSMSSFAYQPDRQVDKTSSVSKGFVFSDPIELMLPNSALPETSVSQEGTAQTDLVKNDQSGKSFKFSSPIEHTLPAPDLPSTEASLPKSTKGFSFTAPSSTWECGTCWVRNPETENKCLACETWRPSKEPSADVKPSCSDQPSSIFKATSASTDSLCVANTSQTSVTSGFKFGAGINTFVSSASTNKTTGFKIPISSASSHIASFGGFSLDSCKTSISVSTTENNVSHSSEIEKSTAETCISASASNNTISSLTSSKPMTVSTSVRNTDSIKETPSTQEASSTADTSSVITPAKETESTLLKGNVDISNTAAFKSNNNVESVTPFPKAFIHNDANLWECDTCLVRNSQDKIKCIACETLRPSKGNSSEKKDLTSFKFSSPLQSSPLIFKFGNPLPTCQSTDTSSSFKFGVPPKTTVSSFFGTSTPISDNVNVSKAVEASSSSTVTSETPSSNTSAENQKSIVTFLLSEKKDNTEESKQETIAKVVTEAISSSVGKSLQTSNVSAGALFGQSPTVNAFGAVSSSTETQAIATSSSTSSVSAELKPFSVPVVYSFSLPVQQQDSKKGLFTSPAEKLSTAFSLSKSQTASGDFLSKDANIKVSSDLGAQNADQASSTPKESLPVSSGGSSISFQVPTNSQPVTSSFGLPVSAAPVFKFGEKDSSKTVSEPSSKSGSIFQSMNPTPAVPTFNFLNTPSNTIASSTPKPTETQATSNNLQFQPSVTQNQDMKSVSVTPFCTAATSNSFTFGTSTAASASAPSGFSFFGSAATSVATGNTSGFSFGASSNTSVESKPGGFTFKSLSDDKSSLVASNAPTFNASTANTASSSVFKFGASAPASTGGFVFGVPKSEPQNVTPAFSFGTGPASASNESTFSGFQPNQTVTPNFQFGTQTSMNSVNNTPAFGVTNTFAFGGKNDTTNQLAAPATQQPTASAFGSIQPVFGNASAPSFGKVDKPASGGFNFGAAASSNPVFVFGSTDKKPAMTPGFSFGTPTQSETPNSFQATFNMNTPPSFNFGATSTPAGPFQFAANSDSASQASAAPRKYRKALRRGLRKQE